MSFYDAIRIGASGVVASATTIDRSARFRGATDQRFDRTLSTTSSSYTVSMWFKTTPVTTNFSRGLFTLGPANNTDVAGVVFNTDDKLIFYGGNGTSSITNARVFRDTSAWYHFTYSVNSNNFTAYINGESLQTGTVRSLDTTSNGFRLGGWWGGYDLFQGYIADFYLIDGSALTPSSFTETNAETGQLVPKLYTGSFGTSGAHLLFADNSGTTATTLGKDTSGNGNNFTPTSFAVSDAVKDTPTNNFCTFNPLDNRDNLTLSEGNLKATGVGSWDQIKGTMGVSSGKWYFEIEADAIGISSGWFAGIHELKSGANYTNTYWSQNIYTVADYGYVYSVMDNNKAATNTTDKAFTSNITAGDIVGFRVDLDNNELSISVNGSDKGKVYDIQAGITYTPAVNFYASSSRAILNCGQDSTFAGAVSSGGNTDANGIGDFKYAVPSGYKAICSANLPDPMIKLPNKYFDTVLYSGTGSSQNITGLEFQPDWVWIKKRSNSENHELQDAVRGATKRLTSSANDAETTVSGSISAFNSNGFTVVDAGTTNESGETYVAWNWNAGGSTATNTDGTISAQVRASTTAGVSIITYTGNGSSATIGHGLGVAPKMIISKRRNSTQDWVVNPGEITGTRGTKLKLNTVDSVSTDTGVYPNTATTSSVYSVGSANEINGNNNTYIAYVFSEVAGYSKFDKYSGNGSSDGPFVFTGFRPAWVLVKRTDSSENWVLKDIARNTFNDVYSNLNPNTSNAEFGSSGDVNSFDFVSNGFKIRGSNSAVNASGGTFIYFAFAESPFKNARAR